ncbi:hypothetical protein Mal64_16030 [Pseudobythopirellula maris]|uniref:PEP-CTERM protein-sorting domain-containing protein n=1 Tax=Pseudobythopirellula maris TaxID=2527991 RepID=A0A5C5ZMP4_9BACT|nr:hypothetical protein [Pseudobythopirellula maris]TWT88131.1 hypothetical protein Mal64_16030 [Pseudobythopirellula maris]
MIARFCTALLLLVALGASPALASIQQDGFGVPQGAGTAVANEALGEITFEWTATPFTAFLEFTSLTSFDLFLDSFVSNGAANDVTGYTFDLLDSPGGSAVLRYTNETNFANSSVPPVQGNTNLFGLPGATNGSNPVAEANPLTPLLTGFSAGSYRLGVYDSAAPNTATAGFRIAESATAQVPEAVSGMIWVMGALLVGGVSRFRTK